MRPAAVAAAALGLALSGCGGHGRVIPWRNTQVSLANLPPTPRYVPSVPRGARRCAAGGLRIGSSSQGVGSVETAYAVMVRNVGRKTCALAGRPWVEVPRGAPAPVVVEDASAVGPPGFPPGGARFGLHRGATASAIVFDDSFCLAAANERSVAVRAGYRELAVTIRMRTCTPRGASLSVTPFAPPEPPDAKPRHFPLAISLGLPASAKPGKTLRYRVKLTNRSRKPFRFPFCPPVEQTVRGAGHNLKALNCRPAGTLEPGKGATFEMRIRLDGHARPGMHELTWELDDTAGAGGLVASAQLRIER